MEAEMPVRDDWKADIDNQKNVTLDDVKFIFAQAEKRLDDGIKNYDATTSKSISFITLTATLLTALAAYFFVNLDPDGVFSPKLCTVLLCCMYTFFVLYRFIGIILPKSYQPIGSYPQDLYLDAVFSDEIRAKDDKLNHSTLYLYLGELENYNCRISQNAEVNNLRLKAFTQAAKLVVFMPGFGIAVYSSLLLVSPLF